jgi:hypothetical protein
MVTTVPAAEPPWPQDNSKTITTELKYENTKRFIPE